MTEAVAEFQGLPIADLIGGPFTAACETQVKLANATADFIRVIGFNPPSDSEFSADPNAVGDVRTALFKFSRPVVSPTDPNAMVQQDITLNVPLLALVDVPALSIKTMDVTFDMEVKSSTRHVDTADQSLSGSLAVQQRWGTGSARLNITGSVSAHQENTRSTDTTAKYHIAVHAEDRGMPEGLARVMNILQTAIVAPAPPLPPAPPAPPPE